MVRGVVKIKHISLCLILGTWPTAVISFGRGVVVLVGCLKGSCPTIV